MKQNPYRLTILACYLCIFSQAIVVNLVPILFIPLKEQFGFSFEQLGVLVLINFVTQVTFDLLFSNAIDKYGFRRFILATPILTVTGFVIFALSPLLFENPYIGFVIGTIIFSGSGGLSELLVSPIINAIPSDAKASAMSLLHSFYAWGQVTVVILTTLLLLFFGKGAWQIIMLGWMILPVINFFLFLKAPLAPPVPEEKRLGMKDLILKPFFIVAVLIMLFGGASEIGISQWSSAFMEKGLELPKAVGDILGMSLFALFLGAGRALYGVYGHKCRVHNVMLVGAAAAFICYITVALCDIKIISLLACGICGIAVSLLWPGTLVVASEKYPLAGAWMFAILAAGGDIGGSLGPWLMGKVADCGPQIASFINSASFTAEQIGLKASMLVGAIFPLACFFCLIAAKKLHVK